MSPETEGVRPSETETAEREIGHDEYNPIGTAVLITIYFLILALMWIFVYFVEFLGRGPTVV